MHRPAAALQTCIDHQSVALNILQQSLDTESRSRGGPGTQGTSLGSGDQRGEGGERSGDRQPPAGSGNNRPSNRPTIARMARESKLTRLVALTSELSSVEQSDLCPLQEPRRFPVELKLSVELRNICVRLATRKDCFQVDGDLREIEDCLMNIVNQLILSLSLYNSDSHLRAAATLKGFLKKFPDMRNRLESSFYFS